MKSSFRKILFAAILLNIALFFFHDLSYALEVRRSVLDNGLVLLTVERHNLPMVKVSVGINAGNLHEPESKAGLAGLVAGLLTEGTTRRTARQISEEIEFVGGAVDTGGGKDFVTANLSVLKKDMDLGFDVLSDVLLHPLFPEEEIGKMKDRIKGSLRAQEDDPGFVASKNFIREVFGSHPYGRLVSGTPDTLDAIARNDLVKFHSMHYIPNNAVMAVVGDITDDEVKGLLKKYFGEWRSGESAAFSLLLPDAAKEKKTITVDKDLTQASVVLGHLGVSRDNPDYYALSVMNYILGGGGFSSRLMQNIREGKGLAYDIHSYFAADKYGGLFQVNLQTKNESANTAIEEILREMDLIRSVPVSDQELSDAQSFLTGSFPMRIETSGRIAGFLVAVEYYGLGADYIENYPEYINSVTKEDILRVAKKYLDPAHYILVVVANQEKAALRDDFR